MWLVLPTGWCNLSCVLTDNNICKLLLCNAAVTQVSIWWSHLSCDVLELSNLQTMFISVQRANSAPCSVQSCVRACVCGREWTSCFFSSEDAENRRAALVCVYLPAVWRRASVHGGVGSGTTGRHRGTKLLWRISIISAVYHLESGRNWS